MARKNRKVWYSTPAEADLLKIEAELLVRASSAVAENMITQITLAGAELGYKLVLSRERSEFLPGIRLRLALPYIIFYRVSEKEVEIVRILHGRRDLKSVFRRER